MPGGLTASHTNRTAVLMDKVPTDPKTEAAAIALLGREERLEHMWKEVSINPGAVIANADYESVPNTGSHSNSKSPVCVECVNCVINKVVEHLPDCLRCRGIRFPRPVRSACPSVHGQGRRTSEEMT
jgi:hypothetical protein